MEKDQIRAEIVESIKNAQTKLGLTLVSEDWGGQRFGCSCALGCVLVSHNEPISKDVAENIERVQRILKTNENWIVSFIGGFDDSPPDTDVNKEAFLLGQEIQDQFNPVAFHLYFREWQKEQDRVAGTD